MPVHLYERNESLNALSIKSRFRLCKGNMNIGCTGQSPYNCSLKMWWHWSILNDPIPTTHHFPKRCYCTTGWLVSFYVKHSFALYDLSKTLNDQHSNCRAITWVYVLRKGLSIFNFSALFRFCKNNLDQNSSVGISVEEFQLIRGMKFSYQAREQNESISDNWSKLWLENCRQLEADFKTGHF